MKFLCLLVLCVVSTAVAHTVRTKDDLASYRQECGSENNLTEEELTKIKKGEVTNDEKTRCYVRCVGKKFEVFEDDKGVNVDKTLHQLENANKEFTTDVLREKILKCVDSTMDKKDDNCTWAFAVFGCFKQEKLKLVQE
ncbi:general odorant-binding protein 99b-like [Culicoides brevitarsis]|uniref:general odorant-binding protein 99b-like n=1 Tax=Culicoides brevitarsis TaxID=469753 RepID=UPI00307B92AA